MTNKTPKSSVVHELYNTANMAITKANSIRSPNYHKKAARLAKKASKVASENGNITLSQHYHKIYEHHRNMAYKSKTLNKSINDISVGTQTKLNDEDKPFTKQDSIQEAYDYNHLLTPLQKQHGYSLRLYQQHVPEHNRTYLKLSLHHPEAPKLLAGQAFGYIYDGKITIDYSEIQKPFRNKGFGSKLYEGIIAHAKHKFNATHVSGGTHSTMASRVHRSIAKKHGMEYKPVTRISYLRTGEFDEKFGPYEYLIKDDSLNKSINDIKPGKPTELNETDKPLYTTPTNRKPNLEKAYDYSHLLTPQQRQHGYSLRLYQQFIPHQQNTYLKLSLHHPDAPDSFAGTAIGSFKDGKIKIDHSEIEEPFRNKGFGSKLYEGLIAHAKHKLNATHVVGNNHSTMASRVHQSISKKHGMDYIPKPRKSDYDVGEFDEKFGPYKYLIKSENHNNMNTHQDHINKLQSLANEYKAKGQDEKAYTTKRVVGILTNRTHDPSNRPLMHKLSNYADEHSKNGEHDKADVLRQSIGFMKDIKGPQHQFQVGDEVRSKMNPSMTGKVTYHGKYDDSIGSHQYKVTESHDGSTKFWNGSDMEKIHKNESRIETLAKGIQAAVTLREMVKAEKEAKDTGHRYIVRYKDPYKGGTKKEFINEKSAHKFAQKQIDDDLNNVTLHHYHIDNPTKETKLDIQSSSGGK